MLLFRAALLVALLGVLDAWVISDLQAAKSPNILFLFADDWGRHASCYAKIDQDDGLSKVVSTPNFDRLAAEGVLFRNAFVNAPSCTPCRSSLLSGQHFWRTGRGSILQGAVWDSELPSWPLLLGDNGYHIGKSWKVWNPGRPRDAPFGEQEHAYELAGYRINQFSQSVTNLANSGESIEIAKQQLMTEVRANFRALLNDRPSDRPFCYWFGPTNVHRRWERGSGMKLWGIDPQKLKGKLPPYLPDVPDVREDLADYLGEVQAMDAAFGVLLDELKQAGEYENTLIIASGDHGPPGFPHGKCNLYDFGTRVALAVTGPGVAGNRVVEDFASLPDLAPTLLEAGGVEIPTAMTATSLWPVLRSDRQGPVDSSRDAVFIGRERHVESARPGYLPYPQRAIRTMDYLYIINFRPDRYPLGDPYRLEGDDPPTEQQLLSNTRVTLADEDAGPTKSWIVTHRHEQRWKKYYQHAYSKRPGEELYDLAKDPHQMQNVADEPDYQAVREKLRARLLDELRRSSDPRLINDGEYFETPPLAGPVSKRS